VLAAIIQQTLTNVFIYGVWPIEPDRIEPLDLDRPKAPDGLAGEDLAEIDVPPVEADAAAGRHGDSLVVEGIVEVRQAPIRSW
jgi:hypothetical protein